MLINFNFIGFRAYSNKFLDIALRQVHKLHPLHFLLHHPLILLLHPLGISFNHLHFHLLPPILLHYLLLHYYRSPLHLIQFLHLDPHLTHIHHHHSYFIIAYSLFKLIDHHLHFNLHQFLLHPSLLHPFLLHTSLLLILLLLILDSHYLP